MSRRKYTQEHLDFMKNNIKGKSYKDLAIEMNARFGTNISEATMRTICFKNGWKNGRNGKFEKGIDPHNTMPVGTVIIRKGSKVIKISDTGGQKAWQTMHEFMWEFFNGPLEPGEVVIFKDGNRDNITIGNLMKASRYAANSMNCSLLRSNNAEMNEMLIKIFEIDRHTK